MYVSSYNYGRDRYLHTQQTTQFRSWWTPLMRIQGGWCRITNSPHPGDWLGSGSMGSFNADDWSVISCCDLGCSLTRVTKSYLLALGTTPISSYLTKQYLLSQPDRYPQAILYWYYYEIAVYGSSGSVRSGSEKPNRAIAFTPSDKVTYPYRTSEYCTCGSKRSRYLYVIVTACEEPRFRTVKTPSYLHTAFK